METIIAVDFDGTIVADQYPGIGMLKPGAKEAINEIYNLKYCFIIINTCRKGKRLREAVNFLLENNIPFHRVNDNHPELIKKYGNTRKIHADIFIDSSNILGIPDWALIPETIKENLYPF